MNGTSERPKQRIGAATQRIICRSLAAAALMGLVLEVPGSVATHGRTAWLAAVNVRGGPIVKAVASNSVRRYGELLQSCLATFLRRVDLVAAPIPLTTRLGPAAAMSTDFDGDGKTDLAVYRPSTGRWYILPSSNPETTISQPSGFPGDVPVPGDYDGDGIADIAIWRPWGGIWYVIPSRAPTTPLKKTWGAAGDVPVPADYDGDGITDFALWHPATGIWEIMPSGVPGTTLTRQWGQLGDIPVAGDFDGDGKADIGVWRADNGTWYVLASGNAGAPLIQTWGVRGDIPVPGDYDGDGKTDLAVWRPSDGTWYVMPSSSPLVPMIQQWGAGDDIPVPKDYDNDSRTDFAVWRPTTGMWYLLHSGVATETTWGQPYDVPVYKPSGQRAEFAGYSGVDADGDGLPDDFEQAILTAFKPTWKFNDDDCDHLPAEFQTGNAVPTAVQRNGTIYGQVFFRSSIASGFFIEAHFYDLWHADCGYINSHPLDAEHVSVLIRATQPSEPISKWQATYWYFAAHEDTICDSGQHMSASRVNAQHSGATVWVAWGKHAAFRSQDRCNFGDLCHVDICVDPMTLSPLPMNLGELGKPLNGALWVSSGLWPLSRKMGTNFSDSYIH
jgi:FG-GAP-like repeat